ncbi:uncharacterized protein [Vicugna pacos]|uniref:Uncharacterized protein n=1 Tax=Vicugna pacos TaxID=30538 RepID=A0ABM5D758_VICPA
MRDYTAESSGARPPARGPAVSVSLQPPSQKRAEASQIRKTRRNPKPTALFLMSRGRTPSCLHSGWPVYWGTSRNTCEAGTPEVDNARRCFCEGTYFQAFQVPELTCSLGWWLGSVCMELEISTPVNLQPATTTFFRSVPFRSAFCFLLHLLPPHRKARNESSRGEDDTTGCQPPEHMSRKPIPLSTKGWHYINPPASRREREKKSESLNL